MKNNCKLILCLLVVIIASLSCVAASEDVNTNTTENNADTSIATYDKVAVNGSDEIQIVNNANDGANLNAANSGDSKPSYNNNDDSDVVTIGANSYSLDKPIKTTNKISNERHAVLYQDSVDNKNFSNLQKALNGTTSGGNVSLNNTTWTYNGTGGGEVLSGDAYYKHTLNITNKNITITGGNDTQFGIIDGNHSKNITLLINGSSNVTLKNIIFQNSNNTAIQVINGSATFINCIFRNNNGTNYTETSYNYSYGGAVYIKQYC